MRKAAVIMAGGAGTRLWPLSRRNRPKQLLRLIEGRSLISEAFERLRAAFPPQDIYVIALAEHGPALAEELPGLPPENLIGEPVGRDTANAIAIAAAILHHRDPETVMGVFTADHLIRPADQFAEIITRGLSAADEHADALITFGIRPTEPHTGLGYVERGDPVAPKIWTVHSFKEKPDADTARQYVASGRYYWNSGMFAWRTAAILEQLRRHLPSTHETVHALAGAWHTAEGQRLANQRYPSLQRISIDYAVMEKAPKVLVVEMDLDWLDVGNWTALPGALGTDSSGNVHALKRAVTLSGKNNILVSEEDHLIAAVGVEDLVIIHSPDATLVCHKDDIQRIKELVARLGRDYGGQYD